MPQSSIVRRAVGLVLALCLGTSTTAAAQELTGTLQVQVVPERPSWTYRAGEPVVFTVTARRDGHLVPGIAAHYEFGLEMLPPTGQGDATTTENAALRIEAGSLATPGFLRLVATATLGDRTYRGVGTAGIDPGEIMPTVAEPSDFDDFWNTGKAQLAKIPMAATREFAAGLFDARDQRLSRQPADRWRRS